MQLNNLRLPTVSEALLLKRAQEDPAWAQQYVENEWLGLGDITRIRTDNPFAKRSRHDIENPHYFLLDFMRRPENFGFTCKLVLNKELYPFQLAILRELWTRPFPMLIGCRGMGKSFLLAVYAVLRGLFEQGRRIVVVGAAFRQAKVIFDYCQDLWETSPVLRDIVGSDKKNGPRRDVDRCSLRLGESLIVALPMGDGSKIRGQRASIILADEYASISKEIFETVVRGFAAVSMNPVAKAKQSARKAAMQRLGLWSDAADLDDGQLLSNQTVISGTAYYSFNHFYGYWKQYKAIIESQGDPAKLREVFGGKIPESFNWKDYSIIRIPATRLPRGFMDEKQLAQARATVHTGTFQMEYGACLREDALLVTDRGPKRIVDIEIGEMVLTHRGRFRPVTKKMHRWHAGDIVRWSTYGTSYENATTPEHPFWAGQEDWVQVTDLAHACLSPLRELSEQKTVDIRTYLDDWLEVDDLVYPRHSQCRFSRDEVAAIRFSDRSQSDLARHYGVKQSTIHAIVKLQRRPKNAIPATLPLNYDLGLILGYYAAEGSTGANGKAVTFSLDGHHDTHLEFYVDQLCAACERTFGFTPKRYRKDNVVNVTLNQRLLVDFFKRACPGVSHTKVVDPELLYANRDFLRGFILGYWNGDGHTSGQRNYSVATCVNQALLCQVRVGLSYFGILASLRPVTNPGTVEFRGKTYETRQAYSLSMNGENNRQFRRLFYGDAEATPDAGVRHIRHNGDHIALDFRGRETEPYEGYVYNLEVAEDNSYSLLNATVHNCFAADSNGFYKRSLIESCVVGKPTSPIEQPSCGVVKFTAALRGRPDRVCVLGVDPASESDNCSIVTAECWPEHRRIVNCWTTTNDPLQGQAEAGPDRRRDRVSTAFVARKIRELLKAFPARGSPSTPRAAASHHRSPRRSQALKDGERPIYPSSTPRSLARPTAWPVTTSSNSSTSPRATGSVQGQSRHAEGLRGQGPALS
jgi:hypothetical protein